MNANSSAPVLVTGALGAIGSWVTRRLVDQGQPFVVYEAREDYSLVPDLRGKFPLAIGDVLDKDHLMRVAREHGVRRIIHLAALMPPACEADPTLGFRVNLLGATTVLDVARDLDIERVVLTSSRAYYGEIKGKHAAPTFEPVTEDYQGESLDVYGATKKALEDAMRHYRRLYGLDLIALRLGSTYGPGKLPRHGAVGINSRIVEMAFTGRPFEVPTPDRADDIVYNRDVGKAIVLACFAPRSEYWQFNVSSARLVTMRAFAEEVMRHCPQHKLTIAEPSPQPESHARAVFSNDRARGALDYTPDFPGETGVADYVAWLGRHGSGLT